MSRANKGTGAYMEHHKLFYVLNGAQTNPVECPYDETS